MTPNTIVRIRMVITDSEMTDLEAIIADTTHERKSDSSPVECRFDKWKISTLQSFYCVLKEFLSDRFFLYKSAGSGALA